MSKYFMEYFNRKLYITDNDAFCYINLMLVSEIHFMTLYSLFIKSKIYSIKGIIWY